MLARCSLTALALLALMAAGCGTPAGARSGAAAAIAPSVVRVQFTLKYDKGEEPQAGGWSQSTCPARPRNTISPGGAVKDERPFELTGFVISPTQVVTSDPMIHPRFIESTAVRAGDETVKAHPAAYAAGHSILVLELEKPLPAARVLAFDGRRSPPYLAVTGDLVNGAWTVSADPFTPAVAAAADGWRFFQAPLEALIADDSGKAVGFSMDGELPADESWMGSPLGQPLYPADKMASMLADLEKRINRSLVRVTLCFRSPAKEAGQSFRSRDDDESATELHTTGIIMEGGKVLVLANLKPKSTARLESIVVHPAEGPDAKAKFAASLADYGAVVATLEKPAGEAVALETGPILASRFQALLAAEVHIRGENRTVYCEHRRIPGFDVGWREHLYPDAPGADRGLFLFSPEGRLVVLPITRREKAGAEERYSSARPVLTAASYVADTLANLSKNVDAHNVPLSEEEERRLAWLGLEFQGLNKELARANKVAELTKDGETGAIVSYVYPNSPAAKAGIEPGVILLRIHVADRPKPIEVQLRDYGDRGPFPWEKLDEVPEQYYDRIPPPWPSPENPLVRSLTDLGFGTKFKAEFFRDGQMVMKDLEVTASPPTYESAPRYKSAALGLTVRDLTYEVRRYFQKKADEPGAIVSKIEQGSKASVAGIKPFEIITHVNDKPVMNVKDFEKAISGQDELRLSVKRMTRGREVKIKMTGAPAPAPAP